jgi:DNA-binding transcriptional regulator YhcF (GntR family)
MSEYTKPSGDNRRRDWQKLNSEIAKTQLQYMRDNQSIPTNSELANILGISERTIIRHLQHIDHSALFQEHKQTFTVFAPQIFMTIYNSALKGSSQAQKMLLQIIFNWAPPKSFDYSETGSLTAEAIDGEELELGIKLLVDEYIRTRK